MPLPTLPKKNFVIKLPSTGENISLTPFTVGQEEVLIEAATGKSNAERVSAIKQIVSECVLSGKINVDNLPSYDLEYIFLKLRANSIGEKMDLQYVCTHPVNGEECNNNINLSVDLNYFQVKKYDNHENTIMLTDTIGLVMKYPTLSMMSNVEDSESDIKSLMLCVDKVINGDDVLSREDFTEEELEGFICSMSIAQRSEIKDKFFDTTPHIYFEKKVQCQKCGQVHDIQFRSIKSLFT